MMKKLILLLTLVLTLTLPAQAAKLAYVTDTAGLLSAEEVAELDSLAKTISQTYQCDLYIVTVDDYTDYGTGDAYDVAKTIYRDYDLGYGEEKSGQLLLLSMDDRDYAIIAYGYGNTAFTDPAKESICDQFLDDFAADDWYDGFQDYLYASESYLQLATGQPDAGEEGGYDYEDEEYSDRQYFFYRIDGVNILIALVLSLIIALTTVLIMRSKMRSVAPKREAHGYITASQITYRNDRFLYRSETRTKIQRDHDTGGTSIDSDGFSGHSRKF